GTARIWVRRIFGTTPGPVLQASPSSWEGSPVTADVDAFSLSVTPYSMARLAMRVAAAGGSALGGRLLVDSLPPHFSTTAGKLGDPQLADGAAAANAVGPPDVAVAEDDGRKASTRLGFLAGSRLRQMGGSGEGGVGAVATPAGPRAQAGTA